MQIPPYGVHCLASVSLNLSLTIEGCNYRAMSLYRNKGELLNCLPQENDSREKSCQKKAADLSCFLGFQ